MSNDWYRDGFCDESSRESFMKRLASLRKSRRAEIMRVKSLYLLNEPDDGPVRALWALELCRESIRLNEENGFNTSGARVLAVRSLLRLRRIDEARFEMNVTVHLMCEDTTAQNEGPMLAVWIMFEHDIEPFPLLDLELTLIRAKLLTANPRFWRHIGLGYVAEQRGDLARATEQVREALTCVHTWHNGKPDWGYGEVSELHRTPDRAMAWIRRLVPEVDVMAQGPAERSR